MTALNSTTIAYRHETTLWKLDMSTFDEHSETMYSASFETLELAVDQARLLACTHHIAVCIGEFAQVFNIPIVPYPQFVEEQHYRTRVKPAPVAAAEGPSSDDQLDLWGNYPVTIQNAGEVTA